MLIFPITLFVAVLIVHLVPSLSVSFVLVSVLKAMVFALQVILVYLYRVARRGFYSML